MTVISDFVAGVVIRKPTSVFDISSTLSYACISGSILLNFRHHNDNETILRKVLISMYSVSNMIYRVREDWKRID